MADFIDRAATKPNYATAGVVADGTNAALVTIKVLDSFGRLVPRAVFDVMLSDALTGLGITATTASGAVGDKTAGTTGTVLGVLTTKKAMRVQAITAGTYQLSITDSAKTAFVVCVMLDGLTIPVVTLATASYG